MGDPATSNDIAALKASIDELKDQVSERTRERDALAGKLSQIDADAAKTPIHRHDGSNKNFMMSHPTKGAVLVGDWQEEEFAATGFKRDPKAKVPVHDPALAAATLAAERKAKRVASLTPKVISNPTQPE